jgi:hypothetical protein
LLQCKNEIKATLIIQKWSFFIVLLKKHLLLYIPADLLLAQIWIWRWWFVPSSSSDADTMVITILAQIVIKWFDIITVKIVWVYTMLSLEYGCRFDDTKFLLTSCVCRWRYVRFIPLLLKHSTHTVDVSMCLIKKTCLNNGMHQ